MDSDVSRQLGDDDAVDRLRRLAKRTPMAAISSIQRGWEQGKVPINEDVLKIYFKAVGDIKRFDHINITALLALLQKSNEIGSADVIAELKKNGISLASPSLVGGSVAGGSSSDPIYVASISSKTWKQKAVSGVFWLAGTFLFFSFVGAMLDEKGAIGGGMGRGILGVGGSSPRQAETSDKTFDDVVGVDEAKGELQEIVLYLKDPKRFTRLGGKLPKGVLLTGPPGTGKTLLARAIAGEANVPFFFASGSEFDEMYVGVGARRIRDLFEAAKAKAPCIIFIDEIDAIGGSRHLKEHSALKMTLNQLLVDMDGFEQNNGVIVIGATNLADSLDSALVRPGRFDKHIHVAMPDVGGRKAILELYGKKIPMSTDVNLEQIARGTPGFSGAELSNLVNQAALKASVDGLKEVTMTALEYAKDKIMMGSERKSAIISLDTMKMTAFHEAGHALVALKTEGADPIHKATIMPRGGALGMVMQLPDGDQTSMSKKEMLARLDVCMGGRVAEELIFGADNVTSGASNDIMQATKLAKRMVMQFGLSDKVGPVFVDEKAKFSAETQRKVDEEVNALLQNSFKRAKKVLETYRHELDIVAGGLMQYESLSGGEIVDLINGVAPNTTGTRSQKPSRELQVIPPRKDQGGANSAAAGKTSTTATGKVPSATSTVASIAVPAKAIGKVVTSATSAVASSVSASAKVPSATTSSALPASVKVVPSATSSAVSANAVPATTATAATATAAATVDQTVNSKLGPPKK